MQDAFASALLDPAAPVPGGLVDPSGRPAPLRFAVYRNNVAVGLTAALETGFPVVRRLVGAEFFTAMAGVFLRAYPPKSRLMMHYGVDLPAFLENFPPVAGLPYLPDVSRLELALRASYHAADQSPLPNETLGGLSADRLLGARLTLAPAVRLLRSRWPVWSIWQANSGGPDRPGTGPEDTVILRPAFDPVPHRLAPGAGAFLAALIAGETLGTAAAQGGEELDLGGIIGLLRSSGAIVGVSE